MQTIIALIFDNFERLDLFNPVQIFGSLPNHYRAQLSRLTILVTVS